MITRRVNRATENQTEVLREAGSWHFPRHPALLPQAVFNLQWEFISVCPSAEARTEAVAV